MQLCFVLFVLNAMVVVVVMVVEVVVAALSSRARIWGECLTIHLPPALFFFFFLKWRLAPAH